MRTGSREEEDEEVALAMEVRPLDTMTTVIVPIALALLAVVAAVYLGRRRSFG